MKRNKVVHAVSFKQSAFAFDKKEEEKRRRTSTIEENYLKVLDVGFLELPTRLPTLTRVSIGASIINNTPKSKGKISASLEYVQKYNFPLILM